jgi:hypothetical protein
MAPKWHDDFFPPSPPPGEARAIMRAGTFDDYLFDEGVICWLCNEDLAASENGWCPACEARAQEATEEVLRQKIERSTTSSTSSKKR